MIRILYFRHPKNFLNFYVEDQIKKTNFEEHKIETFPVDEATIEEYNLTTFQTFIFLDEEDNELFRISHPICSIELESAYRHAKEKLSRLKNQGEST